MGKKSKEVELIPNKHLPQVREPALDGAAKIFMQTAKQISKRKSVDRKMLEMAIVVIDFYSGVEKEPHVPTVTAAILNCIRQ